MSSKVFQYDNTVMIKSYLSPIFDEKCSNSEKIDQSAKMRRWQAWLLTLIMLPSAKKWKDAAHLHDYEFCRILSNSWWIDFENSLE